MPDGLNSQVDLDKGNLSGGQRQKIILARALIHHKLGYSMMKELAQLIVKGLKRYCKTC